MAKTAGYIPLVKVVSLYTTPAMLVDSVRDLVVDLVGSNTSVATVQFVGSVSQDAPDFSLPASESNRWDYIQMIDVKDGSTINGSVGVVLTADAVHILEANVNVIRWFGIIVSAYTSGQLDSSLSGYDNE